MQTRRIFLGSVGAAALGVVVGGTVEVQLTDNPKTRQKFQPRLRNQSVCLAL